MATLGKLEELELEVLRGGALHRVCFANDEVLATDTGRELRIKGFPSPSPFRSLAYAMRLGWRPWRRSIARVHTVTYRTRRFIGKRGRGYLHGNRAAELARRWGAPAYMHCFGDARLMVDLFGRVVIRGGFEVSRDRVGGWGMIRG